MKILKLSVAFLSLLFLPSGQLYAQADNYEKHKNDDVSQISNREMTFYLVFKSHFDIGYSALARDVVHEYRTSMIDKAMDVMDKNADKMKDMQFAWTVPGWPLEQMLWDRQTPERRLRIERALKNGNLVTHALPYTRRYCAWSGLFFFVGSYIRFTTSDRRENDGCSGAYLGFTDHFTPCRNQVLSFRFQSDQPCGEGSDFVLVGRSRRFKGVDHVFGGIWRRKVPS